MRFIRWSLMVLAVTSLSVAGCGGERHSELAKVHGKVTYKGKPLPFGSVLFIPVKTLNEQIMEPASGTISPDGSYELTSKNPGDGAVLGEHKVVVYAVEPGPTDGPAKPSKGDASPSPSPGVAKGALKNLVPKKYSAPDTTPLTRKVVAGDNAIDLEIVD